MELVKQFQAVLTKAEIHRQLFSPFTRLLAMVRPDHFLCITGRNKKILCEVLGENALTTGQYERYWDAFLQPFHKSHWFNNQGDTERPELWNNRVALLDMLFYAHPETRQLKIERTQGRQRHTQAPQMTREEAIQVMSNHYMAKRENYPPTIRDQRELIIELILNNLDVKSAFDLATRVAQEQLSREEAIAQIQD